MRKKIRTNSRAYEEYLRRKHRTEVNISNSLNVNIDNSEDEDEETEAEKQERKTKILNSLANASFSSVLAGVGGVALESRLGKTPSMIVGALGTFIGYFTDKKAVSALGLGLLTAACADKPSEPLQGITVTPRAETVNEPSAELFDIVRENESEESEPAEEVENKLSIKESFMKHYPKRYGEIDVDDVADKLY